MKFILPLTLAMAAVAPLSAQTITNGSFEQNQKAGSAASNSNHVWDGNSTQGNITNNSGTTGDSTYIPNWTITRQTSNGKSISVYQSDTSFEEDQGMFGAGTLVNGPDNGAKPHAAVDGSRFLSIYTNGITPASTTASTTATGLVSGNQYKVSYSYAGTGFTNDGNYTAKLAVNQGGSTKANHTLFDYTNASVPTSGQNGFWIRDRPDYDFTYTNWKTGSFTFTANSTSTALEFIGTLQGGPTQLMLDNVRIELVPEPSSMTAGLIGLAGLVAFRRKRR